MSREPRPAVSGAAVPVAVTKMSGKGSPGRGAYGSLADGEDVDVEGNGELAWYHQPVRRQNPCFLLFSFAFFASLATLMRSKRDKPRASAQSFARSRGAACEHGSDYSPGVGPRESGGPRDAPPRVARRGRRAKPVPLAPAGRERGAEAAEAR